MNIFISLKTRNPIFSAKISAYFLFAFSLFAAIETMAQKQEILLSSSQNAQDARPLISPDGSQLFFGRRNHEGNFGGARDLQDIWIADIDATGTTSNAASLGKKINNLRPNGIFSISPDGNEIIITNDFNSNPIAPIAKSTKVKGEWSKPVPIIIENYYNRSPYVDFYLSYEHQVLFIAAERNNRRGDQDIFVSLPGENGNWLRPTKLSFSINSPSVDFAPFLSADGKTLFFSSCREGGVGGSDIYVSTRLDDTWTNWSEPKNLGPTVNTSGNEDYCSISADKKFIFIETLSKETEKRHLYKIQLPKWVNEMAGDLLVVKK